tara:strand:- start:43 stop:276 length:234 start_codon:yes stop_codon:yes gene_type:complete
MNVEKNGLIYFIKNEDDENMEMLSDRAWFIAHNTPKKPKDINLSKRLSIFYRNIKHLGVSYPPTIQNEITKHSLMRV